MIASFVIGFHTARMDNLLQTLRFLTADHADVVAESYISLVCQDTCDRVSGALMDELEGLREKFKRSCVTEMSLTEMRLPHITNMGVEDAETDKVVVLESDRILPAGYFAAALAEVRDGVQVTCRQTRKLVATASDAQIRGGGYEYKTDNRSPGNEIGQRTAWSGNTAFTKADFERAGRMDEGYVGYGWADNDMTAAMEAVGVQTVFRPEIELHLWHPSATYGAGDQKAMFIDNGLRFCEKWKRPVPRWLREEIATHRGLKVML
jgi:hypothetical protein